MVWKIKGKDGELHDIPKDIQDIKNGISAANDPEVLEKEAELRELQEKVNALKNKSAAAKPKQSESHDTEGINKQEVIDIIQGNLARISQLVELLRRG